MDKFLIEALHVQAHEGNKVGKGFKEKAYVAAANALNSAFQMGIDKDNVIDSIKTLKKGFRDIEQMITSSGITFNYVTKKIECTDAVSQAYAKAHTRVKKLRHKKLEMLDELAIVCGNDVDDAATGEWCRGDPDINVVVDNNYVPKDFPGESTVNIDAKEITYKVITNDSTSQAKSQKVTSRGNLGKALSRPTFKRNGVRGKSGQFYMNTMNAAAESINKMAEAVEKRGEKATKVEPSILLKGAFSR